MVQDPSTCMEDDTARMAIAKGIAKKIVGDIDIPSVLWHILKKKFHP